MVKDQGHWKLERTCKKSFFTHIFVKSGSTYLKPKPRWSVAHSTHII